MYPEGYIQSREINSRHKLLRANHDNRILEHPVTHLHSSSQGNTRDVVVRRLDTCHYYSQRAVLSRIQNVRAQRYLRFQDQPDAAHSICTVDPSQTPIEEPPRGFSRGWKRTL